jgi:hypothetical protein
MILARRTKLSGLTHATRAGGLEDWSRSTLVCEHHVLTRCLLLWHTLSTCWAHAGHTLGVGRTPAIGLGCWMELRGMSNRKFRPIQSNIR